jgi:hypothetical protein
MKHLDDYKRYPKGKGRMIEEIIKAFDDYDNDELKDSDFIAFMAHYQNTFDIADHNFMNGNYDLDIKIANKIGKSRTERLEKMLKFT